MNKTIQILLAGTMACCVAWTNTAQGKQHAGDPGNLSKSSGKMSVNLPAVASAWKLKKNDKETTKAFEARVRNRALKVLKNNPDLFMDKEGDSDFYPLLSYFRQIDAKQIPAKWHKFYFAKQSNLTMPKEHMNLLIEGLRNKPLYEFSPKDLDAYLPVAYKEHPDYRERIMHYAHKNLGQPYNMYLLGEFPFEVYDSSPLFNLAQGDCVVFSEHMYAMTMSRNWKEFMQNLTKIRYKNGVIGYTTRNHYTEADWVKSNTWMIEDLTTSCGASRVVPYKEKIDRAAFFGKYGIPSKEPVEILEDHYIPYDALPSMVDKLQPGDFVNIARGKKEGEGVYIGHVGLIGQLPDGTKTFIHSTPPKSKEEPLLEYAKRNGKITEEKLAKGKTDGVVFLGFKFHRLKAEDLQKDLAQKPIVY